MGTVKVLRLPEKYSVSSAAARSQTVSVSPVGIGSSRLSQATRVMAKPLLLISNRPVGVSKIRSPMTEFQGDVHKLELR